MGTIWCLSTSSTRTPRPRKRASSTRRRVSTTWSRRRRNQPCRSPLAPLSVAAQFKHVQRSRVCRASKRVVSRKRDELVPGDSLVHVNVHVFLQFVETGGSRGCWKSGLEGLLHASESAAERSRSRHWQVVSSSLLFLTFFSRYRDQRVAT